MHIPMLTRRLALPFGALLLIAACASGQAAGWTYAPLGPSANPSAAAPSAAASAGASAGASGAPGSPSGSAGAGTTVSVETTQDQPLAFNPADFTVPAGATVTVNYMNNSNLPHNHPLLRGRRQHCALSRREHPGHRPEQRADGHLHRAHAAGRLFLLVRRPHDGDEGCVPRPVVALTAQSREGRISRTSVSVSSGRLPLLSRRRAQGMREPIVPRFSLLLADHHHSAGA